MRATDLRIIKTKSALKEALTNLLKKKALNSISVTEICRLANVNRGTFYSHYGQVGDLFEEFFRDLMTDLTDSYLEPYKHVQILQTDELNPDTIRIFHHIEKNSEFYRIVFSESVPISYYYLLFHHVQELIKNDMHLHGETGVDAAMLSAYQANAILGVVIEWSRQNFRQSAAELSGILVRILNFQFRGMKARPGDNGSPAGQPGLSGTGEHE
ncbi:TetR/AcrR family transcriptional regulator [Indiicoccus explosivorum]|uniref:TetR/AcrR family transcriptional regulator n=1 Tax=Indiicoccus explosivorum TaxID=1917864 RepID=UPI000B4343AC|nr:TetR-like C-terminal domain-containing protein [Indiicoccus explosivorum]